MVTDVYGGYCGVTSPLLPSPCPEPVVEEETTTDGEGSTGEESTGEESTGEETPTSEESQEASTGRRILTDGETGGETDGETDGETSGETETPVVPAESDLSIFV